MRIPRKYSDFLIYQLLESVMVTTSEFKDIIGSMPEGDKISDILYTIISDKKDIKTNYNLVDLTPDNNDEISFLPDNQYQRFVSKGEDVSTKTKGKAKIGRMVGQILRDNGYVEFKDVDIEKFVNSFKALWNKKHGIVNRKVEIVKGESIKKWYNKENYNSEKGSLGNSCMRYPQVNHFMDIYAANPDKISMVIITEENKLIGRALLWKLDYSSKSNSNIVYLDRIYTEQDSDVQFIYDWVFDNVVKKDKNSFLSHRSGSNNDYELKVELGKTKFDVYPYADTFNYLYEKLVDGELTGSGYVSNFYKNDDEIIDNYLVSEIRNHSAGTKSVSSHRWSDVLEKYISKKDAVNTRSGWLPHTLCKMCNYVGEWLYEKDVIYSETMKDWIPKSEAVEDSKFGWVLPSALKKVVTEYIGTYADPLEIYDALQRGEKEIVTVEEFYESADSFVPEYKPLNSIRNYSNKFKVVDLWSEDQVSFTSYKFYPSDVNPDEKFNFIYKEKRFKYWLLEEDAKLLGIKIDMNSVGYVAAYDVRSSYEHMNYNLIKSTVENSDLDKETKDKIMKMKTYFHNYWLENSSSYERKFELENKFANVDRNKLFSEFVDSIFDIMSEKYNNRIISIIQNYLEDYSIESNDSNIKILFGLLHPFIAAFLVTGDSYDSKGLISKWTLGRDKNIGLTEFVTKYGNKVSVDDMLDILRKIYRGGVDDIMDGCSRVISDDMCKKFNVSGDTFRYFISQINISEYKPRI